MNQSCLQEILGYWCKPGDLSASKSVEENRRITPSALAVLQGDISPLSSREVIDSWFQRIMDPGSNAPRTFGPVLTHELTPLLQSMFQLCVTKLAAAVVWKMEEYMTLS